MNFQHKRKTWIIWMFIPLALSSFTHLWNPVGFPALDQDEGHYMRRAMEVLQGLGPQESTSTFFYAYDHPYFGQLFLAAILSIINYPDSLNPSNNIQSIEMLFIVPRVLMGILAIVDTFLVYKIAETRYNRKIAFISATLFSVMPSTWFLRRILLDSIELPFILLSILFAVYYAKKSEGNYIHNGNNRNIILILLSGIFLGLAIFTKMPVFTMIPLIVFIILKRNNNINNKGNNPKMGNHLKALGIWFVPIILIPMIWPAYVISMGQFDQWLDGVIWQVNRADRSFTGEIKNVFLTMEPVLFGFGAVGLIYAVIKKDYFILLWTFPYLIFLYFVNWVYFYHLIPVLPAFCIVTTTLVVDLLKKINNKMLWNSLEVVIFGAIIIFGFMNSTMLITQNINTFNFELVTLVNQLLPYKKSGVNISDTVTLIGPNGVFSFYWILIQVFNKDTDFKWFEETRDYINEPIKSEKFVMIVDREMRNLFSSNSSKQHIKYVDQLYSNSTLMSVFNFNTSLPDLKKYPYTNILEEDIYKRIIDRRGIDWGGNIEIKANY